jgi:hypothetical protein
MADRRVTPTTGEQEVQVFADGREAFATKHAALPGSI